MKLKKINRRKLLQDAAKAASIKGCWDDHANCFVPAEGQIFWDPLVNDGDAFRLSQKLDIDIKKEKALLLSNLSNNEGAIYPLDSFAISRLAVVLAAVRFNE